MVMQKYNIYNKQYEKDHQTIVSFHKFYRNFLQDNAIDESDYESLCNFFY